MGEDKAKTFCYPPSVDEGRKRTLLIAASILMSRKFAELGARPSPALDAAIAEAITMAERIMQQSDKRSGAARPPDQSMNSSNGYPWKSGT